MINSQILRLKSFLENIDSYRDKFLFLFIKPYWPRNITPNHISWLRVFISIILFVLMFFYNVNDKTVILTLFIFGALTDLIDGPVARGLNEVTAFGAKLDSTADRILLLPIAVYSLIRNFSGLLYILILIELLNAILSIYYNSRHTYLKSNIFGKTKMLLVCIVFIIMLFVWPTPPPYLFILMLWLTIPFTLLSMFIRIKELLAKNHEKT